MTDRSPENESTLRPARRAAVILVFGIVLGPIIATIGGIVAFGAWGLVGQPFIEYPGELGMALMIYATFLGPIHGAVTGLIVATVLVLKANVWPMRAAGAGAVAGALVGQLLIQGVSVPLLPRYDIGYLWLFGTPAGLVLSAFLGVFTTLRLTNKDLTSQGTSRSSSPLFKKPG